MSCGHHWPYNYNENRIQVSLTLKLCFGTLKNEVYIL